MTNASFHLNLLADSERVSSSPVRLRVILPMLALLSAIGMALWWGSIFTQQLLIDMKLKSQQSENEARKAAETEARRMHLDYLEYSAELSQLDGYATSVRRIGPALAKVAETMPFNIQLISLAVEPPAVQDLKAPNPRAPLLRGPTNTVETQVFSIDGRTAKALYANHLKKSFLETPTLAALATSLKTERSNVDTSSRSKGEARATLFHLEYTMPPRAFVKPKEEPKKEAAK